MGASPCSSDDLCKARMMQSIGGMDAPVVRLTPKIPI